MIISLLSAIYGSHVCIIVCEGFGDNDLDDLNPVKKGLEGRLKSAIIDENSYTKVQDVVTNSTARK